MTVGITNLKYVGDALLFSWCIMVSNVCSQLIQIIKCNMALCGYEITLILSYTVNHEFWNNGHPNFTGKVENVSPDKGL